VPTPRTLSYLCMLVLAIAVGVFHLGPALLAGLLSYTILDLSHRRVTKWLRRENLRWAAVVAFAIVGVLGGWSVVYFVQNALRTLPELLVELWPQLHALADRYQVTLPFGDTAELRDLAVRSITDNFEALTKTGGLLTERVFHVVLGVFIAVLAFTSSAAPPPEGDSLGDRLWSELSTRVRLFMHSFELVFGAQVAISAINAALSGVFLVALGFPNAGFLVVATFLLGLLPIIGNLLSNTLIIGVGVTLSLEYAVLSLVFLVTIHKLEYFLNSRIVGGTIRLPMWQTLLAILVGEVVLGVPGIVIAPALIHYVREELTAVRAPVA